MDLDHVCHLHAQWFSNLRIRRWSRDYVEYRLTSHFFGFNQEIFVKGAPIDNDSYWYEFNGSIAQIRVDGSIKGTDGDLTLTEVITYKFNPIFAPIFWLFKPFFKMQKEDILNEDTKLLERMHELELKGFQRAEDKRPRVVVFGGSGFFGKLIVEDLLENTDAQIIVASRTARKVDFGKPESIHVFETDINDAEWVKATIRGADVVICATGPFQGQPLTLLKCCIEQKVHYIDVAEDRDYVLRCHQLADEIKDAGIMAFIGCSVIPGMSALLAKYSQDEFGAISEVRTCITPGTRNPRGVSSFICLLNTVGEKFQVDEKTHPRTVEGWTEREKVVFPPPIGERHVYSIIDVADYYIQPLQFGTEKTSFKIGAELDFLNRCLSLFRLAKKTFGWKSLSWFVPFARPLILLSSMFGTTRGGFIVDVKSREGKQVKWCVYREERGEIIPAFLPAVATQMILSGELKATGVVPLDSWLTYDRFREELALRHTSLVSRQGSCANWGT